MNRFKNLILSIRRLFQKFGPITIFRKTLFVLRLEGLKGVMLRIKRIKNRHRIATISELLNASFENASPLRIFLTPPSQTKRLSMVTDSINRGSLYGGVGTAMIFVALLAESTRSRLRIVTRTEPAQPSNFSHVLSTYGISLSQEVEFVYAPCDSSTYEVDIFQNELFVTTSWWGTAATMASVPHRSIIYLLQEDERMFYPYGDERLHCEQVFKNKDIRFVINSRLLFDHLVADGFENISQHAYWFEPAFPKTIFYPRDKQGGKHTLMFYARPNNLRNLFYFGIELLEKAIVRGVIDLSHWEIVLVGKDIPDLIFAGGYTPVFRENMNWLEYAELIGTVDLGLCLMYTPHPSYPPLDLAASGAIAVTNRFLNKDDLSGYSKNILTAELDQESMLVALEEGLRLAVGDEERNLNYSNTSLETDWSTAFAGVLEAMRGE